MNQRGTIPSRFSGDRDRKLQLFEECVLPHLDAAHNLARWLTRNDEDAQDIVQEAYLRAFRFFDGHRGGDGKAWLLTIVRNTFNTWRRRENRDSSNELFDEAVHHETCLTPNEDSRLDDEARINILQNCIEILPVDFRDVIVMRELEEMSYREISEVVAVPVGTVMSRLSRARKRLEDCAASSQKGTKYK